MLSYLRAPHFMNHYTERWARLADKNKINSYHTGWRNFWIIGSIITVGRRKSFPCDGVHPSVCIWCSYIRCRWVHGNKHGFYEITLRKPQWRKYSVVIYPKFVNWKFMTGKPYPFGVQKILMWKRWYRKTLMRKINTEIVVPFKNSRIVKYYGKEE